mmetsp:Transcript_7542/g.27707  ORF Transcript_7542/g.27707 Transcript_7542/m.27707 type:complete len:1135 (+) Transcript_7542:828-4232(+)
MRALQIALGYLAWGGSRVAGVGATINGLSSQPCTGSSCNTQVTFPSQTNCDGSKGCVGLPHPGQVIVIYDEGLGEDWHNWSFQTHVNFHAVEYVFDGQFAMSVISEPFGGLRLFTTVPFNCQNTLSFYINDASSIVQITFLSLVIENSAKVGTFANQPLVIPLADFLKIEITSGNWFFVTIDLSDFCFPGDTESTFDLITWFNNMASYSSYFLDEVYLVQKFPKPSPPPALAPPTFTASAPAPIPMPVPEPIPSPPRDFYCSFLFDGLPCEPEAYWKFDEAPILVIDPEQSGGLFDQTEVIDETGKHNGMVMQSYFTDCTGSIAGDSDISKGYSCDQIPFLAEYSAVQLNTAEAIEGAPYCPLSADGAFVEVPASDALNTRDFTITAWVKITGEEGVLFSDLPVVSSVSLVDNALRGYFLRCHIPENGISDRCVWEFGVAMNVNFNTEQCQTTGLKSVCIVQSKSEGKIGEWVYLVATLRSAQTSIIAGEQKLNAFMRLYVAETGKHDGVDVAELELPYELSGLLNPEQNVFPFNTPLFIGAGPNPGPQQSFFHGSLDDIAIHPCAFDEDDVDALIELVQTYNPKPTIPGGGFDPHPEEMVCIPNPQLEECPPPNSEASIPDSAFLAGVDAAFAINAVVKDKQTGNLAVTIRFNSVTYITGFQFQLSSAACSTGVRIIGVQPGQLLADSDLVLAVPSSPGDTIIGSSPSAGTPNFLDNVVLPQPFTVNFVTLFLDPTTTFAGDKICLSFIQVTGLVVDFVSELLITFPEDDFGAECKACFPFGFEPDVKLAQPMPVPLPVPAPEETAAPTPSLLDDVIIQSFIYTDFINPPWFDNSFGVNIDYGSTDIVFEGTCSAEVQIFSFGSQILISSEPFSCADELFFVLYPSPNGQPFFPKDLFVQVGSSQGPGIALSFVSDFPAKTWTEVKIPLSFLCFPDSEESSISFYNHGVPVQNYLLDNVAIVRPIPTVGSQSFDESMVEDPNDPSRLFIYTDSLAAGWTSTLSADTTSDFESRNFANTGLKSMLVGMGPNGVLRFVANEVPAHDGEIRQLRFWMMAQLGFSPQLEVSVENTNNPGVRVILDIESEYSIVPNQWTLVELTLVDGGLYNVVTWRNKRTFSTAFYLDDISFVYSLQ